MQKVLVRLITTLPFPDVASGRLLETQDANHSYKMILEHNQSHSESLTEKSKKMKNPVSEVLQKPQETEKAKSQLSWKNEEQQLELLGVGYGYLLMLKECEKPEQTTGFQKKNFQCCIALRTSVFLIF